MGSISISYKLHCKMSTVPILCLRNRKRKCDNTGMRKGVRYVTTNSVRNSAKQSTNYMS
jgi:hypothetical protein